MIETAITFVQLIGLAAGATFLWYPTIVLLGGGGNRGEEDQILGMLFIGLFIVLAYAHYGVLL